MNRTQKEKILKRIVSIEADIKTLKDVRMRLATSEYVSASMSSGGGSKSYTKADLGKVTETIAMLLNELKGLRTLLGGTSPALPNQTIQIWI